MSKKRVLIVEDELALREALNLKLVKEGFEVLMAKDGVDGLEISIKEKPDAIILDVVMPKMDGMEMASKLRTDQWGKDAKIIVLSNLNDMNVVEHATKNGIFNYFVKSDIKIEEVIEKVKELLGL